MNQEKLNKLLKFLRTIRLGWLVPYILFLRGEDRQTQLKAILAGTVIPLAAILLFLLFWHVCSGSIVTKFGTVPGPRQVWSAMGSLINELRLEKIKEADHLRRQREKRLANLEKYSEVLASMPGEPFVLGGLPAKKEAIAVLDQRFEVINALLDLPNRLGAASDLEAAQAEVAQLTNEKSRAFGEVILARQVPLEMEYKEMQQALLRPAAEETSAKAKRAEVRRLEQEKSRVLMTRQKMTSLATGQALDELNSLPRNVRSELGALDRSFTGLGLRLATWLEEVEHEEAATGVKFQDATKLKLLARTFQDKPYPGKDTYLEQIGTSLKTVFFGFVLASLVAIPIGILCGLNPTINNAFNPLIQIFKPVSPLAWLPIVMIVVGALYVSDDPMFELSFVNSAITVALCSLWPTLVNTAVGVASTDKDFLNVARVLKLSWFKRIWKVVLPSSLPLVFTGLRLSLGVGWMVLIAAEMLAQNPGLGKFVWDMFQNGSSETLSMIMVAVFTIGLIGFLLDTIMLSLQQMVSFGEAL